MVFLTASDDQEQLQKVILKARSLCVAVYGNAGAHYFELDKSFLPEQVIRTARLEGGNLTYINRPL